MFVLAIRLKKENKHFSIGEPPQLMVSDDDAEDEGELTKISKRNGKLAIFMPEDTNVANMFGDTKMTLQRCFLQVTKQYLSRHCILQSNLRQTYSETCHKYSSKPDRRYSERHEWVTVDKDIGTVGISQYAQESLGDIVFAQLPSPGTNLKAGDECGALESVKAASEIYSPVSGTVTEKNKDIESKPGLINTSCYDKGWLFKLKLSEPDQIKSLMSESKYEVFLKTDSEKETS